MDLWLYDRVMHGEIVWPRRKVRSACISEKPADLRCVVAPECRLRNGAASAVAAAIRVNGGRGLGIGLGEDGRNGEE